MRKNPFSLYDFLGFVFPGILALTLAYILSKDSSATSISAFYNVVRQISLPFSLEETVLITIAAYITGHLAAYISSVTVEKFSIWVYDYPSKYLLDRMPSRYFWRPVTDYFKTLLEVITRLERQTGRSQSQPFSSSITISTIFSLFIYSFSSSHRHIFHYMVIRMLWRILVSLMLLPISLGTLIVSRWLKLKEYLIKPLDRDLRTAVLTHTNALNSYLNTKTGKEADSHRIIYHYEYERNQAHAVKMDNYVALYGFLRACSLIFNCLFMWIFCTHALPTFKAGAPVDWPLFRLLLILGVTTYIFFLAFIKFYRRFTLESFMCLITDTSYHTQTPVEIQPLRRSRRPRRTADTAPSHDASADSPTADTDSATVGPQPEIETAVNTEEI